MIGGRIRAARLEKGLGLREVARRIPMNPGYLSQIEHGLRVPSSQMLADLGGVLGVDLASAIAPMPIGLNTDSLSRLADVLGTQRRLEDTIGAAPLVTSTVAQLRFITKMVIDARGPLRRGALDIAAQWAQFTGWLHAAVERYADSDRWFSRSLEWAIEADNDDLVATVLSYKGHVMWLRGKPEPTIGLSQAARRHGHIYPGQLAYDMLQEARGHAILGNAYAVDRLVGESDEMTDRALRELPGAPPWHYYRSPAFWNLERGRALARLPGREKKATELLTAGLAGLPADQRAADWVGAYRRDLAAL